jgi:hypothetical protein
MFPCAKDSLSSGIVKIWKLCFTHIVFRLHKSDMESFFLCNGNETQKIVSPAGGTIFVLRGSLEWFAQGNLKYLICANYKEP